MRKIILALIVIQTHILSAQQKEICFTLDDLPVVSYGIDKEEFYKQVTGKLLDGFDKYNIPAIGFVNEGKLYANGKIDSAKLHVLETWLARGYELGNHTYSHPNYHRTEYKKFTEDVIKGEKISRPLSDKYNMPFRYFRHPFLKTGLTEEATDSLNNFLHDHDYQISPVTIDNQDYLFARSYTLAYIDGDTLLMGRIGDAYLNYMEKMLLYYENMSVDLFKKNISHVLLIHANQLNADYLGDLAGLFLNHGYKFVTQQEVLNDPVYSEEIISFGDWGISWLERWALSKGKKGEYFSGTPRVPEFIEQ